MEEVDPFSLPTELFDELYLPKEDCWKHHYSVMRIKQKRQLEPLLKQAGIVLKTMPFDKEEDAIIMRNWNEIKDDLGFEEGSDARMFVGFGKKKNPGEVSECLDRARDANFNKRICKGLQHRFLESVRHRFELLFDPKRLNLQRNNTPYVLVTPNQRSRVEKDGKIITMNEDELNQVLTAMKEAETHREAGLALQESMGVQWTFEFIENQINRLDALDKSPLEKDKWNKFYKTLLSKLMLVEKKKSELELIDLLEDEDYDWKRKAPWVTVALSRGVKHTEKYLIRAWREILSKIQSIIAKFRENGRPFVIFLLYECVLHEEGFDEWRVEQEREDGMKMEETEAREAYEKVLISMENHLIHCQRKRNGRKIIEHHEICRFENGQLVKCDPGDWISSTPPVKNGSYSEQQQMAVDKEELASDDDDDDGPLQDPVVVLHKDESSSEEGEKDGESEDEENEDVGEAHDANENEGTEVESAYGEERGDEFTGILAQLLDATEGPIGDIEGEEAPLEKKKKKKKKRSIESTENGKQDEVESAENKKKRKKEKRRLSEGDETTEAIPPEVSSPKKKKEKRVEDEEHAEMEETTGMEESAEVTEETPQKKKKKKKKKRRSSNEIIEQ